MHPILKCCGYYCACLTIMGIIFFAIMIGVVANENPYLVKGQTEDQISEKITALVIAIVVNGICFVLCVACVCVGKMQEDKMARLEEENEKNISLPTRTKNK